MRPVLPVLLLLCSCAGAAPPTAEQMAGFRSSSSTMALDRPTGPSVAVPTIDAGAPLAGISVSCRPSESGLNSSCRAY